MDKNTILDKVKGSNISPELKEKLFALINSSEGVDESLISRLNAAIDGEAESLIEEIANTEMQVETDKYNRQMQGVGEDVNSFVKELGKKADEVDLEEARKSVAES